LLKFYMQLGHDYMPHFDARRSTTNDVVRNAIIPMTSSEGCAAAVVMMEHVKTRPHKMVTHNWSNLFRDLVAAIVADALDADAFKHIAHLLENNMEQLLRMLKVAKTLDNTYWVCAFSVDQHASICGNPYGSEDTVTKKVFDICPCGKQKFTNASRPTREDGKSIACEMNKFDDMMAYLFATDVEFAQVIAVDQDFTLFSRAWCVAEIAAAFESGSRQYLKVYADACLTAHEDDLRGLKIENMEASRPEDITEILSNIADTNAFNDRLQSLIFGTLVGNWRNLDLKEKLRKVGHVLSHNFAVECNSDI